MTLRIALFCAALTCAGAAHAQLPGVGLPGVGLPGAGLPSFPSSQPRIPRTPDRPALPKLPPPSALPTPTAFGAIPSLNASPLGAVSRELDVSSGLAADANAVLGLSIDETAALVEETAGSYRDRARELLQRHGRALEADAEGRPVVRGEVLALGVSADALARARKAGFRVREQGTIDGLGLATATLAAPRGVAARDALERLRSLDPAGRYDLNHIYVESGGAGAGRAGTTTEAPSGHGLRIGLVDGTALRTHPTLRVVPMTQKAFAPGAARVTTHATAVASLIAGSGQGFRGAAPGASLYVADVYGSTPAGGSALTVARALGWLAQSRTPVINISLVGPPNTLLEAAVSAAIARGHLVVAAVGNDGPAAGPLYPAAYPGVVAVTGVDARRRVLPEAGRGPQVAFAAPGADMLAASLDGGVAGVRGSSFAAPLVAGRLARLLPAPDPAVASRARAILAREAVDAGAPGRDPVFGVGLVALEDAVRPATATARRP
jgi:hypothetical protein